MRVVRSKLDLRAALEAPRRRGESIGLVPTMGALHGGHLSLIHAARAACDVVVVTLFVNPAQFGPVEDLAAYPRDEASDIAVAEAEGVDLLFAPSAKEMYPHGFTTAVEVSGVTGVLEGAPEHRGPEHFRGVTTIVAKLLNLVQPEAAFFGQKDAQQAIVLRTMARDLDFSATIEVLPTVREPDGLAMSSRNRYLDSEQRARASALSRALGAAEDSASSGETSVERILDAARQRLAEAEIEPEYLEARDAEDLTPVGALNGRPVLIAVAARFGGARLIDNTVIEG